jgi:hypothetical protein
MASPFLVSVDREQVTPVVTLSLSKPEMIAAAVDRAVDRARGFA